MHVLCIINIFLLLLIIIINIIIITRTQTDLRETEDGEVYNSTDNV